MTREEFLLMLPHVGAFELRDGIAKGTAGPVAWQAAFEPRAPRQLGSLCIPVLAVALDVRGEGAAAFVERFLRVYQRAGG